MDLFQKLDETKVFRCPVHTYIHVDYKIIYDLINTFEFLRLRRVSQLGGTKMVFASSEHSRFMHSLGTYEIARRIIQNVKGLKEVLSEREVLVFLVSALLHDVGHGPYSHLFEKFHKISHEEYTYKIIREDSEIASLLDSYDPTFKEEVVAVIKGDHPNKIIVELISSQLDCDRMDYLLRDAYFSGTPYGYFDVDRLIRVMRVKDGKVVYKASGINGIENYILGRFHMYGQVYYHPVSMSYELLVLSFLNRLKDLKKENFKFNFDISVIEPFLDEKEVASSKYVLLDDYYLQYYLISSLNASDAILKDIAERLLNRKMFKEIKIDNVDLIADLKKKVIEEGYNPFYYFYEENSHVSIYEASKKPINILYPSGEVKELSSVSMLVNALIKQKESVDVYCYLPKEVKL